MSEDDLGAAFSEGFDEAWEMCLLRIGVALEDLGRSFVESLELPHPHADPWRDP